MEKSQFSCYTVLADASLVEEYSVHCITRLFSLFYMICLVYPMISVAESMKRHTRWKVIWLAVLGLAVQLSPVWVCLADPGWDLCTWPERNALCPDQVRVTRSTITVHRCWKWEEQNWTPFDLWWLKLSLFCQIKKNPYTQLIWVR